ncbi:MAG: phage portal protein [Prevotella sp.]
MFNFLTHNKEGQLVELLDLISADLTKIQLSGLAKEKAICMIANAIAKSEIVLSNNSGRRKDEIYYRLNVRPNDNQTGTDFWFHVVERLLATGDCLVIPLSGKYYMADAYSTNSYVLMPKLYSGLTLTDGSNTYRIDASYTEDEVLHFMYGTDKLRVLRNNVLACYDDILQALNTMETIASHPIFKYKTDSNMTFMSKNADGTVKKLALDDVLDNIKAKLTSSGVTIMHEQNGTSLEYMNIQSAVSASDAKTYADQINDTTAMAFDIPKGVFDGTISEKSDATNEFITYAVQPVAEVVTDTLNAKLVGCFDYIKGERAFVWMSHFKHIDVIDAASNLDKLRSIGFSLDEIFEMVGYPALNTDFSQERAITKNYATGGEEEGDGSTESADDLADESDDDMKQMKQKSKHTERRLRRNAKK